MQALLRIRRGVGWLYVVAGLLHAANMTFASLYALRKISFHVSAQTWTRLHFGHFLFLVGAPLLYLALSFHRERLFYYEALGDFLVGVAGYFVLLTAVAFLLVSGRVSPWLSLLPSAALLAYGAALISGRAFGVKKPAADSD